MHCRTRVLGIKPSCILEKCLHQQTRTISHLSQKSGSFVSSGSVHTRFSDELEHVTKITDQLLNAASRSRVLPTSGWKHKKSLRGEEKRLEKDIRKGTPRRPPTKQLAAWQEAALELDETDESQASDIPSLGTYVDIRRHVTNAIRFT